MVPMDQKYLDILRQAGSLETVPKGHTFYDGYDSFDSVYCLEEGLCALMSLKDSGKEHVYHYIKPGSLIGFIPAFLESIHQQDTESEAYFLIEAKSRCTVYRIGKEHFFELMQAHPEILKWVMTSMANTSRHLLKHFYEAQESNAVAKIAVTLLSLSEEVKGEFILKKEFHYLEISKYLGIHHITVARIMGGLKESGVIDKTGQSIRIKDLEALSEYAQNRRLLHY